VGDSSIAGNDPGADQLYQRLIETGAAARVDTTTLIEALQERLKDEPVVREREVLKTETTRLMDGPKRQGSVITCPDGHST
jgi:hypothetical protein